MEIKSQQYIISEVQDSEKKKEDIFNLIEILHPSDSITEEEGSNNN